MSIVLVAIIAALWFVSGFLLGASYVTKKYTQDLIKLRMEMDEVCGRLKTVQMKRYEEQ